MGNFSLVNNIASSGSQFRLQSTNTSLNKTLQRLSSGLRINKSGDDAAGLAIANTFRSDSAVLAQGVRNANDGLSTLQIIDGGLNTISGLLDRAASLASQSASGTFTGDRGTLQAELGKVFNEIDRQAQNIGLGGATGSDEGRFNKAINVFIGGGANANAAGNSVAIDLSNSRVDKTGLDLNNLNIGTGTGSVTGAQDITGATGLATAETLTFQTVGSSGQLSTFQVALSAGSSSSSVLDTINNDSNAQSAGIKASLSSGGELVLSSANFFAVSSSDADGAGQTGIAGAGLAAGDVAVTGAANSVTKTITAGTAASTQTLSFTGEEIGFADGSQDVSFTTFAAVSAVNTDTIVASVNSDTALRAGGVFAVRTRADGSEVSFVSLNKFNAAITSSAGAVNGTNNIDALQTPNEATAGVLTGGEDGAKDALAAIKSAIAALGDVQGKVGAGQNNLEQAIDLASTQIVNFQAAESSIRDADVAAEASNMARLNTLQQAGVAALAQANQSSQALLSLLR